MSQSQYLQVAIRAIKEAEKVINQYYSDEIRATLKLDQSPVTIADQEAEQIIRKHITTAFPDHRILGEEQGKDNNSSPFLWVIDPIDGTKNYMRKVPLFSSLLALMKDGEVILGISNAPALGELAYAEKGQGTYINDKKVQVSKINKVFDAYLCFGGIGYFERNQILSQLLKIEKDTLADRGVGDFWCYHLLAQGKIDIMLEAQTKVWDIAAVSLLVQEAGGRVTDMKGQPINETTTSIIATNGLLHDQVSAYFG